MSHGDNYQGQESGIEEITPVDAKYSFTEQMRKLAYLSLKTGQPNTELNRLLRRSANQRPFPSHQAQWFLRALNEAGISTCEPLYDEFMQNAWRIDEAGFPHLARMLLADVGINYPVHEDLGISLPADEQISHSLPEAS